MGIEIGWPKERGGDEDDVVELLHLTRQKLGTAPVADALWQCRWVDFEGWYYARIAGQPPPTGQRACGVDGLDCCAVYHGWAEKVEYFTGVPWDLPCDCGVGAALGCTERET